MVFSSFVAADFFKKESRSPRGFLPRPLLRAGESITPPPYPQKNCGGAHQKFRSKKVRANVRITPPNLICRRSCLGASPLGIGFNEYYLKNFIRYQQDNQIEIPNMF